MKKTITLAALVLALLAGFAYVSMSRAARQQVQAQARAPAPQPVAEKENKYIQPTAPAAPAAFDARHVIIEGVGLGMSKLDAYTHALQAGWVLQAADSERVYNASCLEYSEMGKCVGYKDEAILTVWWDHCYTHVYGITLTGKQSPTASIDNALENMEPQPQIGKHNYDGKTPREGKRQAGWDSAEKFTDKYGTVSRYRLLLSPSVCDFLHECDDPSNRVDIGLTDMAEFSRMECAQ